MPLILLLFLTYAGGLWLGFSRSPWPVLVAALYLLFRALSRRAAAHALGAGALALGWLVARDADRDDRACRRRVLAEGIAIVRLTEPLRRDGKAAGWMEQGCRLRVRLSARGMAAPTGATLRVEGTFRRAGGGVATRGARVTVVAGPSFTDRWRDRVGNLITSQFGDDAPLVRALVLAEQYDLSAELRSTYADAGIIHMVSVSGLHVSIVAGGLLGILAACGLSTRRGEVIALLILGSYIVFIASPPPAVRSAAMLALTTGARWVQRPTSPWAIWAVGSGISLLEPRLVMDLGWQLSVSGMAGLIASGELSRGLFSTWSGWKKPIAESVVATSIATLVSAPIVAWTFGRISIAAVVTNLLAGPLFNVAQPLLFATVILAWFGPVAAFLSDAARGALALIDLVAQLGTHIPLGVVPVALTAFTALSLAACAAAVIVACLGRARTGVAVALGVLALAAWRPLLPRGSGRLEVHMIDVGQGDAIAVRTPRGRWLLIDAGGSWKTGDAGQSIVGPYLRRFGGRVVHLVLSHPHADHVGGAASLINQVPVDTVWDSAFPGTSPAYRAVLDSALAAGASWQRALPGRVVTLDDVVVRVLAPDSSWVRGQDNPNEASVVVMLEYGAARFLFTGDAEHGAEAAVVARFGDQLSADVLKAGHHGSQTSSTPAFLDVVGPTLALVSVGADNDYGHPSPSVLQTLNERGVDVLRTDDDGTIVVSSDGVEIAATTQDSTWHYSAKRSGPSLGGQRPSRRR